MRWLSSLVLLLIAAPTLSASLSNIRTAVEAADSVALARLIESSNLIPDDVVTRVFDDAIEKPVARSCEDDVSRAMATLAVYLLNRNLAEGGPHDAKIKLGQQALLAIDRRITCSPADGNAWLMRAEILQALNPDSSEIAASLAQSYRFAGAESWIMGPRFEFAMKHFDFVQKNLNAEFLQDLRVSTIYAPPDVVAKNYIDANPKVRWMMSEILDELSFDRREAVAANTDRLGLTLQGPWDCSGEGHRLGKYATVNSLAPRPVVACGHR